ncbi:MAG: S-layer homology domain-containing protein [Candidatus Gracilibacteria bacterium]|nr:S-layer homology domain-containing protein [Candidatus Gracilibacteria bacterium]
MPRKKPQPMILIPTLIGVGLLLLLSNWGDVADLFKTQLLQAPESITPIKLVKVGSDPVSFDVFMADLINPSPKDFQITLREAQLTDAIAFPVTTDYSPTFIVQSGELTQSLVGSTHVFSVTNISQQNSTKIGRISTTIAKDSYINLTYDILREGKQETVDETSLPLDFPIGYHVTFNPTPEMLYVRTPRLHSILGPDEKLFSKTKTIDHGALLIENTLTTYQKLSDISIDQITSEGANIPSASLLVHQQQIRVPAESTRLFDTVVIRYRSGQSDWQYSSHLLTASTSIQLPIPTQSLLDFYTEVQYSFAYLGNGYQTMNANFPFNSLLDANNFAALYRNKWTDLTPQLLANRTALPFELSVIPPTFEEGSVIGFLSHKKITTLSEALHYLQQKTPAIVFTSGTKSIMSFAEKQGSFFTMIGGEHIIWSQKVNSGTLDFNSPSFPPITSSEDDIPDQKLLCFIESNSQSYSLGVYVHESTTSGACALSAKRAGFDAGKISVYRADPENKNLSFISSYDYERSKVASPLRITNYSENRTITVDSPRINTSLLLHISPSISFEEFQTVQLVRESSISFSFAETLPNCSSSCFIRVVERVNAGSESYEITSAALMYSPKRSEMLQLCFSNMDDLTNILTPTDLTFSVISGTSVGPELSFISATGCYEYIPDSDNEDFPNLSQLASNTVNTSLPPETITIHTNGFSSNSISIPPQRHYTSLQNGSKLQLAHSKLVFEYHRLDLKNRELDTAEFSKSQMITGLSERALLQVYPMGNVLIHKRLHQPIFLDQLEVDTPINETLIFPQDSQNLQIPHIIKILPPREVIDQSIVSLESGNLIIPITLPIPSDIKVFLQNSFRSDATLSSSISNQQIFSPQAGFAQFKNASGSISFQLTIEKALATDTSLFQNTIPPTPIPQNSSLFQVSSPLVFDMTNELSSTIGQSQKNPFFLPTAVPSQEYSHILTKAGINSRLRESKFSNTTCSQTFSLDPSTMLVTGTVDETSPLSVCTFFTSMTTDTDLSSLKLEYTQKIWYAIPILSQKTESDIQVLSLALEKNSTDVNQTLALSSRLEQFGRSDKSFVGTEAELSPSEELTITFDSVTSSLQFQGSTAGLSDNQVLYFRAIDGNTGLISRIQIDLSLAEVIPSSVVLTSSFPNQVNIPVLLRELDFSENEINSLQVSTDVLPSDTVYDSSTGILLVQALSDLEGEKFSVQLTNEKENQVRVDFIITLAQAEELNLTTKNFSTNVNFSINLIALIPTGSSFVVPELPNWIQQSGPVLSGKTPSESLAITLQIQDLVNTKVYLLPIISTSDEEITPALDPDTEEEDTPSTSDSLQGEALPGEETDAEGTQKSAAETTCFPDINLQPKEYQLAICLAKNLNIISGSGGLFKPDDSINRAEISKILVSGPLVLFNIIRNTEINQLSKIFSRQTFFDVPQTAWFHGFVETIKELQVVDGFQDGSFKPSNSLTRAEASKMIVNTIAQLSPGSLVGSDTLKASAGANEPWFTRFVNVMNANGGNMPEPNEFEELGSPISRAQFIYNLMIVLDGVAK